MYVLMMDSGKMYLPKGYSRGAWLVYGRDESSNYGRVPGRRHAFRLIDSKGRIRYRGYSVFENNANYGALLRPLIDFGIVHGCCRISYKVGKRYREVPIEQALHFARLCGALASVREFRDLYDLRDLTESSKDQITNYIKYVFAP